MCRQVVWWAWFLLTRINMLQHVKCKSLSALLNPDWSDKGLFGKLNYNTVNCGKTQVPEVRDVLTRVQLRVMSFCLTTICCDGDSAKQLTSFLKISVLQDCWNWSGGRRATHQVRNLAVFLKCTNMENHGKFCMLRWKVWFLWVHICLLTHPIANGKALASTRRHS